jgi:predicted acetylornithine/succinylornithine family transaminase
MTSNRELLEKVPSLLPNYRQPPIVMVRGEGRKIWDADGREYLDFSGGIAVLSVGHSHPRLVKAIADQAGTLMHTSNLFYTDKELLFAAELTKRTGFGRVYFCSTGTEANEALIKLARRHFYEKGDKARTELVSTHNSFHGRTMGALSLTGQPKYHAGMQPLIPGVHHVAFGDLDAMRAVVTEKTAAIFIETVQAEGGILVATDEYLRGLRALADEKGCLLFFDEVQTGYGRTGKFLGREWSGVMPDACSLAKGIGGGFPLAAMVLGEHLAKSLPVGSHGTTFGGNPLACAAGLAAIQVSLEEDLPGQAARKGEHLLGELGRLQAKYPDVLAEVRGKGLLIGMEFPRQEIGWQVASGLFKRGVLVAGTYSKAQVIRIEPALNIPTALLDEMLNRLEDTFKEVSAKLRGDAGRKPEPATVP